MNRTLFWIYIYLQYSIYYIYADDIMSSLLYSGSVYSPSVPLVTMKNNPNNIPSNGFLPKLANAFVNP